MSGLRVDVHVHLGGIGTDGSGISASPRFRRSIVMRAILHGLKLKADEWAHADRIYVERLAGLVRASTSIDRAVVLAMDGRWREGSIDRERSPLVVPNDWARDAARAHRELLYGASVNPLRTDALDELDRVKADGAVLIKWLPNVMGFDPADPRCLPFYRKLAALRLPLLAHAGAEFTLPGGAHGMGDPMRLRGALDQGATVIIAHCGTLACCLMEDGERVSGREALARLMARYENLWADLSAMTSFLRGWALRRVLDDGRVASRLLDASDFPVPPMPFTQLGRAPVDAIWKAWRNKNLFDQDRALKIAAGMPPEMTLRAAGVLGLAEGGGRA
jgi:predicted TIM-barrel fold metal-dependent hydrolase